MSQSLVPCILAAGALHLLIASSNFFAARILDYRGNLAGASLIVREIFWVQNLFIELVLTGLALACFFFAPDLAGRTLLGQFFSGFLALFWGLRLLIQLFVYDAVIRKLHPLIDRIFLVAQVYLTSVFAFSASGWFQDVP